MSDETQNEAQQITPATPLDKWRAALEAMPSKEELARIQQEVSEAREALEKAEARQQEAAVQRACVLGFGKSVEENGTSARQLHVWWKRYPQYEDLSQVPYDEFSAANKTITDIKRTRKADLPAFLAEAEKTMAEIREGMNK